MLYLLINSSLFFFFNLTCNILLLPLPIYLCMRGGVRLLEDFCILALGMASPILVFESTGRHYVDGPGGIERKGFFFFFFFNVKF